MSDLDRFDNILIPPLIVFFPFLQLALKQFLTEQIIVLGEWELGW
jgi:hypothetical protein